MSGTIVELEASIHQRVQKLLAFEDTLGGVERELVEQHAAACQQCRDDLAWQRKLRSVHPAAGPVPDMDAALARMLPRLEGNSPQAGPRSRHGGWMGWALAAQLLVIAGLGVQLSRQQEDYRLLGNPVAVAPAANVIVQFADGAGEREVQELLRRSGARVVDGPTVTHAWLLRVDPGRVDAAVNTLRASPGVSMAEPLQVPQ
ncbi:MAG TPA: hypothetical protein VFT37_03375 [Telluria sp.]|nr:hypothetical protein [Telluria sp.]